jgi:uncharacterized protein YjiS (DUF1127 family)
MPADISMDHAGLGRRAKGLTVVSVAAATATQRSRQFLQHALGRMRERRRPAHPASRPRRRDLRHLDRMSDRMLSDIGLTRDDVRDLRRTPFYYL